MIAAARLAIAIGLCACAQQPAPPPAAPSPVAPSPATPPPAAPSSPFARQYTAGEPVSYLMHGINDSRVYDATATGIVRQNAEGAFYEDIGWTKLVVDGKRVELSPEQLAFRQQLSLDLQVKAPFPDLRTAHPMMIGPILDLMTFYVDLQLGLRHPELAREGDHVYVAYGKSHSWANAARGIIVGEDTIDFDLTLTKIDTAKRTATLLVKHVPPAALGISLPATWMQPPVVGTSPNNWVQVVKAGEAFDAGVGHESFDVEITVELGSGKLVVAKMVNPVDVLERECSDAELSSCKEPSRHRIMRHVYVNP